MAVVSYLIQRTPRAGNQLVNDLHSMLLAIDNAVDTSNPLILARAVTVAKAQGHNLPAGYFDSAVALSSFDTAGEYVLMGPVIKASVT